MKCLLTIFMLLLPAAVWAQPLWSVDQGAVEINQAMLDGVLAKSNRQFSLPVDSREFQIEVLDVSMPNLGVTSLKGRIDKNPESFFLLCHTDGGATVAFFQPGDGSAYRLDHTRGQAEVYAVDYEKMGSCGGGISSLAIGEERPPVPVRPNVQSGVGEKAGEVADDGSRHDILVAYTPAAELVMGGWDLVRAEAQLAIEAANLAYLNSGIPSYLRLVHVMSTDYEEITAWDYSDHLDYLWFPDDGRMDDVLSMRDKVGADFVSVLIDGRNFMGEVPICGIAPIMQDDQIQPEFESLSLSIVSVSCATGNWSLAHEVGHNRGCAHNREDSSVPGAYTYAYGHRYDGSGDFQFRTVMSYDDGAGSYTRIPHFSNPEVSFGGGATGVTVGLVNEAHNALTTNNTAALCGGFRSERTFVKFGWPDYSDGLILFPYPSIVEALAGSRETGTIVIQNDNSGYTGLFQAPRSYVHDGTGSAVLGGN